MPMSEQTNAKREALNIRIKPELRDLIDQAASIVGKNRTEFMLEAARHAAEDTLLDHTVFTVDPKVYKEFLLRLDEPPKPSARLRRALETAAPWEK